MNNIIGQLSHFIDRKIAEKLIEEYNEVKGGFIHQNWEKTVIHAGKFCEIVMVVIKHIKCDTSCDINDIHFGKLYSEITNMPKQSADDEILTLLIPRIARSIYTLRSKRSVAHIKDVDPSYLDCTYLVAACDWILSEFLRLYHTSDPVKIIGLIEGLVEKKIPLLENFEDDLLVLDASLSAKQQILLILYHFYPNYVNEENLDLYIKDKSHNNILTSLRNTEKERLVYRKNNKCKLTKKGIKFIEDFMGRSFWGCQKNHPQL